MRILCFIDNMGSGGAQRQLTNLAIGFKKRGHDVTILLYGQADFYIPILKQHNIEIFTLPSVSKFKRLLKCRKFIRQGNFNYVLSFLETPSFIAEISTLPFKNWILVVGERSANPKILSTFKGRLLRLFHVFADVVVSNSYTNRRLIKKANPFLKDINNKTIYNIYDLKKLSQDKFLPKSFIDNKFHIVIAASHQKLKNFENLAYAVSMLPNEYKNRLCIDWYGRQLSECYLYSVNLVKSLHLEAIINFYPATPQIYQKMVDADAVGLFSVYEGLPNTICEALCLGKPVIASDVSDNSEIIDDKKLICDPLDPSSIEKSLKYLMDLSINELSNISNNNRSRAEHLFNEDKIINQYLSLAK